ncbi:MAG: glycerophosphodiester phosphodiesterase family protein [Oscillospiraceae bacterium]
MNFLYALEAIRNPVMTAIMSAVTYLGSELLFIAAAIIAYWCVSKKTGYYLMATGFIGTITTQFAKILCHVPRPWVKDPNFTIVESARADASDYSFPSGHTQNAATILGGIGRASKKTWVRVVTAIVILLVGFSRMYLGVHTPADVCVALVWGLVLVFVLWPVFEKSDEKPQNITIVFAAATVLALVCTVYVSVYPWPSDIDADNLAAAVKNLNMMLGCSAAVLIGAPIERKKINFETKAPLWAQVLKVVLGLVIVLVLRAGLKPLLNLLMPGLAVATAIRYGIIVLFAILVWPLTFPWFAKGCPLGAKAKKVLLVIGIVLLVLVVLLAGLFWFVTHETKDAPIATDGAENPLITELGVTMLSGHRAGGGIAPENTMMALKNCVESTEYELDIFEFDLHMTADGVLVLLHDATLDRTSDAAEVFGEENVDVGSKTFAELRQLNMGAKFVADDGSMPYAGLSGDDVPDDLRIITLSEALTYLEQNGDYGYIIEIKNSEELGFLAADMLYMILRQHDCLDRAVIGTFHNEVTDYIDRYYPDMLRSAGVNEVLDFYLCTMLNKEVSDDHFRFQALQIPTTDYVINLGISRIVNYAHEHNIAVQYWTINDAEEMARLQSIGADAIMTDLPDLAATVLNQP